MNVQRVSSGPVARSPLLWLGLDVVSMCIERGHRKKSEQPRYAANSVYLVVFVKLSRIGTCRTGAFRNSFWFVTYIEPQWYSAPRPNLLAQGDMPQGLDAEMWRGAMNNHGDGYASPLSNIHVAHAMPNREHGQGSMNNGGIAYVWSPGAIRTAQTMPPAGSPRF